MAGTVFLYRERWTPLRECDDKFTLSPEEFELLDGVPQVDCSASVPNNAKWLLTSESAEGKQTQSEEI